MHVSVMSENVTTSIRLSPRLRRSLEQRAKKEQRGKNWIINRALEEYLNENDRVQLALEARRQSLVAAQVDSEDWSAEADLGQWK